MKNISKVFVTVGTTNFQNLIDKITTESVLNTLKQLGVSFVQIQTGIHANNIKCDVQHELTIEGNSKILKIDTGLVLKYDIYFERFQEQIEKADLIISHAGAGSCLDVLKLNKPLVVVINEDLMDNHQVELAEQLQKNGYLYYCTCDTLQETLNKDFSLLKSYPEPDQNIFPRYLDKCCGFSD